MTVAITIVVRAWRESRHQPWLFGAGFCGYFLIETLVKIRAE
jgi:hypothetical protein